MAEDAGAWNPQATLKRVCGGMMEATVLPGRLPTIQRLKMQRAGSLDPAEGMQSRPVGYSPPADGSAKAGDPAREP